MPEISVAITAYNLEKHLPLRFKELKAQTFQDLDVIILDDCSSDATAEIIKRAAAEDPARIKCILCESSLGNPARARNRIMDSGLIDGRYVVFLDGDDTVEPDFLEKLHTLAVSENADMAICAYDRVERETGHVLCQEMRGFPRTVNSPSQEMRTPFINTSLWNKLIRTDVIGQTRIPDFRIGEDCCFLTQLYLKCNRLAFTDEVLIHYGVRADSVISNTSVESIYQFADELERQLNSTRGRAENEILALTAFIHIGLSMAIRASQSPDIDLKKHLGWTHGYMDRNGLLQKRSSLNLSALLPFGKKGLAIWVCRLLYRINGMGLFLSVFNFVTSTFHIDFKF